MFCKENDVRVRSLGKYFFSVLSIYQFKWVEQTLPFRLRKRPYSLATFLKKKDGQDVPKAEEGRSLENSLLKYFLIVSSCR